MMSLQEAVQLISSDKVTERVQGVEQYRLIFSNDAALRLIGQDPKEEKRWLRTMQALFNCVLADRRMCAKNGIEKATQISVKRLQDSAGMVLWMIERGHTFFGEQCLASAVNHLLQMLEHKHRLMEPLAVPYLKSLQVLFSYGPHSDHLEESLWRYAASMCFDILLVQFPLGDEVDLEEVIARATHEGVGKEVRRTQPHDLEAVRCLYALVQSSYAPLLDKRRTGVTILYRIAHTLAIFPLETSIHLPIVRTLNVVLATLRLNAPKDLHKFAELACPSLVSLWNTKGQALKEQIIITLRTLEPVMSAYSSVDLMQQVLGVVLSEGNDRLALQPLSLQHVELCRSAEQLPFQYHDLRASRHLSIPNVLSWSCLELGADLTYDMHAAGNSVVEEDDDDSDDGDVSETPAKRRKLAGKGIFPRKGDALTQFLALLAEQSTRKTLQSQWYAQVLLFIVLRHFLKLSEAEQAKVVQALLDLLSVDDAGVQTWAFIGLAVVASSNGLKAGTSQAWQTACRHVQRSATCRAACHLAHALLRTEHMARSDISASLAAMLGDMDLQGPVELSDAACAFLSRATAFASADVGLARTRLHENMLKWLRSNLTSSLGTSLHPRSRSTFHLMSGIDTAQLFSAICKCVPLEQPILRVEVELPRCAMSIWAEIRHHEDPMEDFLLKAQLPIRAHTKSRQSLDRINRPFQGRLRPAQDVVVKCSAYITDLLRAGAEHRREGDAEAVAALSENYFRDIVELATTSLDFHEILKTNSIRAPQEDRRFANQTLTEVLQCLASSSSITPDRKASLLLLIESIFAIPSRMDSAESYPAIRYPGPLSGVRREVMREINDSDTSNASAYTREYWARHADEDDHFDLCSAARELFDATVATAKAAAERLHSSDDVFADQDFEATRGNDAKDLLLRCLSFNSAFRQSFECDHDTILHGGRWLGENADADMLVALGSTFFHSVRSLHFKLGVDLEAKWMERVGTEVLASYKYEYSLAGQLLALNFLDATRTIWLEDEDALGLGLQICRHFMRRCGKKKFHPSVELKFAYLMQSLLPTFVKNVDVAAVLPGALEPSAVMASLCTLAQRPDFGVRYSAAALVASFIELGPRSNEDLRSYFDLVKDNLPCDREDRSQMASRILTLANIFVTSADLREYALYHLLEVCTEASDLIDICRTTLGATAKLLGFTTAKDLWLAFADKVVWGLVANNYEMEQNSFQVFGYSSLKEWAEDTYLPAAPLLLLTGSRASKQAYKTLCGYAAKQEKAGLDESLPTLFAGRIAELVGDLDGQAAIASVGEWLKEAVGLDVTATSVDHLLVGHLDAIVTQLLMFWHEPSSSQMYDKLEALSESETRKLPWDLLTSNPGIATLFPNVDIKEPTTLHINTGDTLKALATLSTTRMAAISEETAFSVIHRLGSIISSEQLLHAQLRYLHALLVYACAAWPTISRSPIVLRLLVHSCTELLGQEDLATIVTPLLCTCITHLSADVPELSTALIALAERAIQLSSSQADDARTIGLHVLHKLDFALISLFKSTHSRSSVLDAVCAWPREVPEGITEQIGDISLADMVRSLRSIKVINEPFLRRYLTAMKGAKTDNISNRALGQLWPVLSKLNADSTPSSRAGSLLADMLYECEGHLTLPSASYLQQAQDPDNILLYVRDIDRADDTPSLPLHQWIVLQLVAEIRSGTLREAQAVLLTVRQMLHEDDKFAGQKAIRWPGHVAKELKMINAFDGNAVPVEKIRKIEDLQDVQHDDPCWRSSDLWSSWLSALLCELMAVQNTSSGFGPLAPLLRHQPRLATKLLPAIVHVFCRSSLDLRGGGKHERYSITEHLLTAIEVDDADPNIWRQVIAIVLQLREDAPGPEAFSGDKWVVDMGYFELAERAVSVHLYASALLFLELHMEHSAEDDIAEHAREATRLQYDIYSNIDDPDSFYGVKNPDILEALHRRLEHEGHWQRNFELQAAQVEASGDEYDGRYGKVSTSLQRMGLNRMAMKIENGRTIDYDVGWRTQAWDLPFAADLQDTPSQSLYGALRAVHQEPERALGIVEAGFAQKVSTLREINMEASKEAYKVVQHALCLREVRIWGEAQTWKVGGMLPYQPGRAGSNFDYDTLEPLLSVQVSLLRSDRHRKLVNVAEAVNVTEDESDDGREGEILLTLSERARKEDMLQNAFSAVTQAQHLLQSYTNPDCMHRVTEELANVLWQQNDHTIAIEALQEVLTQKRLQKPTSEQDRQRRAQALINLGEWRSTARSHAPKTIAEECFRPALKLLDQPKAGNELASVCYRTGIFADEQYRVLSNSVEARELERAVAHRQEEIKQLEAEMVLGKSSLVSRDDPYRIARSRARKILALDQVALTEHEEAKNRFRSEAVNMFARNLILSDQRSDDALMRLTALWFENAHNKDLCHHLIGLLARAPSWKFVPLSRQLCSRLTRAIPRQNQGAAAAQSSSPPTSCDAFQKGVFHLVFRMALDHPFHTLYPLYALARGTRESDASDRPTLSSRARGPRVSSGAGVSFTQAARIDVASELIEHVATQSADPKRILAWQTVCDACVEWAQVHLPTAMPTQFGSQTRTDRPAGPHRIPANLRIHKLRDVNVPVITAALPIDPTSRYTNIVSIAKYAGVFATAGGVHLPKITDCHGSDGKTYRQLFKDLDDLRQDAVMQQVFTLVNRLLEQDRRARRRSLHVRTYVVVPLGPRYGLLEYVNHTTPLLAPIQEQYKRHHVNGWLKPTEARQVMANATDMPADYRRSTYEDVCRKMPPVLRFHFLQTYTVPMALLTCRLNYARSVATTSIVGHMMGLGDRHSSNILLDVKTGEVVHIDFGVAFDQGRLLPIPELVPFRLTRNVIDGMGLNGVEGVFRNSCQETLRVLRAGASVIKTVLEVFRYDPLYDWKQTPIKVIQAQGYAENAVREEANEGETGRRAARVSGSGGGGGGNMLAAPRGTKANGKGEGEEKEVAELLAMRAINSVLDKLSTNLSVEYTVNDLMMRAMDPTNLGCIFHGWQAAL